MSTRWCLAFLALFAASTSAGCAGIRDTSATRPPNILLIIADDLGVGELGCYGQTTIRTPHLDALADRGVRFTNAYSGSCVCAPSRCTLLTGLHTGHSAIRDNKELAPEGQQPLPAESVTIASLLRRRGYATAAIGKWGLGPPGSSGDPSRHGFDYFFGYLCQRHAHNNCPAYLYRNDERVTLDGNRAQWATGDVVVGAQYAPDLFLEEATAFLQRSREHPFFLLYATPVPHAALQVPQDSIDEYKGEFDDPPYDGSKGYLKHPTPRAAYAAMVSRLDRDVGTLLARLRELGLEDDTLVLFTSDNGPTFNGGTDSAFFRSTAGRRGLKCSLYEGGIRVPLIASWKGHITGGAVRDDITANWDLFPTFAAVAGVPHSGDAIDGVDLSPALFQSKPIPPRESLYWEYSMAGGWQAVRLGNFKAVRRSAMAHPDGAIELYDLATDPNETTDVAAGHAGFVRRAREIMASRTDSPIAEWNFGKATR